MVGLVATGLGQHSGGSDPFCYHESKRIGLGKLSSESCEIDLVVVSVVEDGRCEYVVLL
jgi:hypothetical protein